MRAYSLVYGPSGATQRSLLQSVQVCAAANVSGTCAQEQLPATKFTYQNAAPSFTLQQPQFNVSATGGTPQMQTLGSDWQLAAAPDYDGDGTADLILTHVPTPHFVDLYLSGSSQPVEAVDVQIKFEIEHEGRIELEQPDPEDRICGVPTLTPLDMATTKLLANSDRWADDAVQNRDVIDIAMMLPPRQLLRQAVAKASTAYGDSIERDLVAAVTRLKDQPDRLDGCMQDIQITIPKALLWKRLKALLPSRLRPSQRG